MPGFQIGGRIRASHPVVIDGKTVRVIDDFEPTHVSIDSALLDELALYRPGARRDIDDFVDAMRSVVDPQGWAKLWLTPNTMRRRLIRAAERYDIGGCE